MAATKRDGRTGLILPRHPRPSRPHSLCGGPRPHGHPRLCHCPQPKHALSRGCCGSCKALRIRAMSWLESCGFLPAGNKRAGLEAPGLKEGSLLSEFHCRSPSQPLEVHLNGFSQALTGCCLAFRAAFRGLCRQWCK